MAEDSALKKARDKLTGAIKGKIPDATAIISGMASGNPAVMLGTKHILDSLSKLTKKVTDSENKKTTEDSDKKGNGILSPQFETKLFTLLDSMRSILFAGLSPKAGRGRLAQIEKDQEFKQFLDKFLDIQEDKAGAGVTIDGKKQSRGITGLLSGIFGFGTLGAGKGILARVFGALVPMKAPQLIKGLVKRTPILGLAAGLIWMATDAIAGVGKADLWNVSKVNAGISGAIGGTDKGLKGAFKNAGKWALIGAGIGSFVPVVGTIAGGLIGAAIGGILGWIGGERISGFLSRVGDFFTMEKMAEVGKSLAEMMGKIGKWIGEGLTTLWFGKQSKDGEYVGGILGWLKTNVFDVNKLFENFDTAGTFATAIAESLLGGAVSFIAGMMEGFGAKQETVSELKETLEHLDLKKYVEDMATSATTWFFDMSNTVDKLLGTGKVEKRIKELKTGIREGTATVEEARELKKQQKWVAQEEGRSLTAKEREWNTRANERIFALARPGLGGEAFGSWAQVEAFDAARFRGGVEGMVDFYFKNPLNAAKTIWDRGMGSGVSPGGLTKGNYDFIDQYGARGHYSIDPSDVAAARAWAAGRGGQEQSDPGLIAQLAQQIFGMQQAGGTGGEKGVDTILIQDPAVRNPEFPDAGGRYPVVFMR